MPNPFPIHGPVGPDDLADREAEVARVLGALREPGAKLLIYGPRRMGKTSILSAALARHEAEGGSGLLADFSTASSPADMTNRLLEGASRALGRRWRDYVPSLMEEGVFPVLHCTQEIPCDPCAAVCPQGLIQIDPADIRSIPRFLADELGQTCTGCQKCVTVCPGLAITLVDYRRNPALPTVTLPYEFSEATLQPG
ncbi:MAG: 4Fe-4S dicluster domain-containing protein, partial [Gemmatimonadota bacterium]